MPDKMQNEYDHEYITKLIVDSLGRAIKKYDLYELQEYEIYDISENIEENEIKIPSSDYISVGLRLGIGIAAIIAVFGICGAMLG